MFIVIKRRVMQYNYMDNWSVFSSFWTTMAFYGSED